MLVKLTKQLITFSLDSELIKSGDGFDSNESLTFAAEKKSHILIILFPNNNMFDGFI